MSLLSGLFRSPAARRQEAADAAIADPIIDRLVAKTEKRLAQVPRYREALRGPVLAARGDVAAMIARIPGPVAIGAQAWSDDAGVRPLFASGDDAVRAFSDDEGVRAFFEAHPGADCFGMLALAQSERRVLATVQQGEMMVEVARTTVSFGEPQVLGPGVDEVAVRAELVLRALEYLTLQGMERVGAARAERRDLEKDVALLRAQVQLAERRGAGFASGSGRGEEAAGRARLERDLAQKVAELERSASRNLLPALLEEILASLSRPGESLSIEPCTLALDAMNFAVPAGTSRSVTPGVAILKLARRGPFAVVIARFARNELRPRADRLADAARFL